MNYSSASPQQLFADCAARREGAWNEFIHRYDKVICATISRTVAYSAGRAAETCEELVQDVYAKLCENDGRILRRFAPSQPGGDFGYIKKIARNLAIDSLRNPGAGSAEEMDEKRAVSPRASDDIERNALFIQIDGMVASIVSRQTAKRDRQIFWFHHLHGWSIRELAAMTWHPPLTEDGIDSLLYRIKDALRKQLAAAPQAEKEKRSAARYVKGMSDGA